MTQPPGSALCTTPTPRAHIALYVPDTTPCAARPLPPVGEVRAVPVAGRSRRFPARGQAPEAAQRRCDVSFSRRRDALPSA
ncbi:hypothetical protein GCM10009730_52800 [Streptomyces albidochromogenes]